MRYKRFVRRVAGDAGELPLACAEPLSLVAPTIAQPRLSPLANDRGNAAAISADTAVAVTEGETGATVGRGVGDFRDHGQDADIISTPAQLGNGQFSRTIESEVIGQIVVEEGLRGESVGLGHAAGTGASGATILTMARFLHLERSDGHRLAIHAFIVILKIGLYYLGVSRQNSRP